MKNRLLKDLRNRSLKLLAMTLVSSFVLLGCGSAASEGTADYGATEAAADTGGFDAKLGSFYAEDNSLEDTKEVTGEEAPEEGTGELDPEEYTKERKIVYTSSISIETKKFDEDIKAIRELVQANGGYYESSSISGRAEYDGRCASYSARIPANKYQQFMDSLGGIGSVTSSNENVDDITSQYVDVQARLKSLRTKLARLEELEAQAQTVEDLLAIEDRINDVQYDLENYTAQLRLYDDKVDYCTVSINVNEVVTYSEVKKDTAWNRFAEAFEDSFASFVEFLQGLVIALIFILPYALVVAVIVLIIFFVTKKRRAARKKRRVSASLEKEKKDTDSGDKKEELDPKKYTGPNYK